MEFQNPLNFFLNTNISVCNIFFIQTDLENTDYTLEAGAKRLFEAEKIAQQMAEEERKAKEEDEMNPMKVCFYLFLLRVIHVSCKTKIKVKFI